MNFTKESIVRSIIDILQLQLFLTLTAFPILLAWGLPLSWMSLISTPLFSPLFTLFLLLSSLIFFTELLFLPNALFIYGLEKVAQFWLWILHFENGSWLIGFTKPSFLLLLLCPLSTLFIMHHKKIKSVSHRAADRYRDAEVLEGTDRVTGDGDRSQARSRHLKLMP